MGIPRNLVTEREWPLNKQISLAVQRHHALQQVGKYNENTFEKSGNDIILGLYFFFVSINPNKRIGLLTTHFRAKLLVCYVLWFCYTCAW